MYDLWCIIVCFMHWISIFEMLQKNTFFISTVCVCVCVCDENEGFMISSWIMDTVLMYIFTFSSIWTIRSFICVCVTNEIDCEI